MPTTMLATSNAALIPFVFAFVALIIRFYIQERASSIRSPTFLLAIAAAALPICFLATKVLGIAVPYLALVMGVIGIGLSVAAVVRFFQV